ncbi:DUF4105 domain-containing protein [Candidatus Gracilibacteria bacterium]|nr:DUF4105 domain-containing protein [Candidatus Gracilibacteria bacterium]
MFQRVFLLVFISGWFLLTMWWISQEPSLYRDWEEQDAILADITWLSDNEVRIDNIRNHTWLSDSEFTPGYLSENYSLSEIERVYYSITPFSDRDGPAHTMLSFSFSDGKHIVISAEVRKERGESFSILGGVMNQFELQYVIATEEDVIQLRTHYRKNEVYMYPILLEQDTLQLLFRSMLFRADKLSREPEFYHTFWNNCTTTILQHANALRTEKIAFNRYAFLPAHSDRLVYELGLIDTELSQSEARAYYRIDEIARQNTSLPFSEVIRREIR